MMSKSIVLVGFILLFSCHEQKERLFIKAPTKETGIVFKNSLTASDDVNILDYLYYYNGGGVALGDINNDGLLDVFLSANQLPNKLYLNKGNLTFEDISKKALIEGNSSWNTGAIMGDINGDGLIDIYVCAVVGVNGFYGHNELYINNGNETFTESAKYYNLDFDSYSSSAAFLDFDLDGDLDIYLLNHATHTQESFGNVTVRSKRNYQTGDKLLRNDGDSFTDISEEAGIFGGVNGYGLGVAIADFNKDGYPDIFVGNDFHEDDYYYINKGDGTFSEQLKNYFGHTSRFSMGNDAADINHDGWPDLLSLDMLAEDEIVLKSSEGDDNIQIQKLRTEKYGYHYQFTRNMMFINQANSRFLETGLLSGIGATDWSWSGLFADYDQDGEQDLFISNGIPKRPNDLDFIKFVSNEQIQKKIDNTKLVDQEALNMMPSGETHNYIFKGSKELKFQDKSGIWIDDNLNVSGATAFGDLDNDGDLDLVINNINEEASIYINQTNEKRHFLKLKFNYFKPNSFGIGTKVYAYSAGILQYKELYTVRGFQSSSEPVIHFGFGSVNSVDSIRVVWPNNTYQTLKNISTNQTLTINPEDTQVLAKEKTTLNKSLVFKQTENNLGLNFTHEEDNYIDFNRQKLIPYQISDRGPGVAIGDLNNDGKDDVYFGSSKFKTPKVYVQGDSQFNEQIIKTIYKDSITEDVEAIIADFNGDSINDIIIGTGGGDFFNNMPPLLDKYYSQNNKHYLKEDFPAYFENANVIKAFDYDLDGDLDLFIGNNAVSNDFGNIPNSYVLNNDNGYFSILKDQPFQNIGMVTDAIWDDFNSDGFADLIIVGEWMSPKFFRNEKGNFVEELIVNQKLNGLWQQIIPFDIDNDGDTDYLLGNWGENSKFKASKDHPLKMYYSDFDNNETTETIVCNYNKDGYYPILGLDELASQLISLRKKYPSYKNFAGKQISEIIEKSDLDSAKELNVHTLSSGYLKNINNQYTFVPFKSELQIAPITSFLKYDFDDDGTFEILVGGNYFGVTPYHGRFDSFPGALIKNDSTVILGNKIGLNFSNKAIKSLNIISFKQQPFLMVTVNNDKAQVYELTNQ